MLDINHPVTKLANLRDLGGAQSKHGLIAQGLLFRSDDIATIDQDQLEDLLALNLGLVIDLRSKAEVAAIGRGPMQFEQVDYLHLPLLDYIGEDHNLSADYLEVNYTNQMLGQWYASVIDKAAPMVVEAISAIAEHSGPVLFHCAIGKDRTGMLAASIYSALEVDRQHIEQDFAKTDENLPQILARLNHSQPIWTPELMQSTGALMRAETEAIRTMFESLESSSKPLLELLQSAGLGAQTQSLLVAKHT